MRLKFGVGAFAVLSIMTLSPANADVTEIKANPQKNFKHRPSGVVVPASATGIPRTVVEQFDDKQLDFAAEFRAPDNGEITTIYIFRNVTGDVPLWFDRIQRAIEARKELTSATIAIPVAAFTPAGQANARGLRVVYEGKAPWKSTAAALTITGQWYVAVRASSQTLAPEQMLTRLEQTFAAIKWPKDNVAAAAAVPVAACQSALSQATEDAEAVPDDGAAILLSALLPAAAEKHPDEQALQQHWCRDPATYPDFGVYRPDGAKDRYFVAFQDAGRGIWVGPNSMAALLSKNQGKDEFNYMVELIEIDRHVGFGNFKTVPSVAQATWLMEHGTRKYSTSTWGKNTNVEIDPSSMK